MATMTRDDTRRADLAHNTVTVTSPLLSFLWANITFHVEHHLYPRVPFFRLPDLHKMLAGRGYIVEPYPLYRLTRSGARSSSSINGA
jgi:fatty acid desaturase